MKHIFPLFIIALVTLFAESNRNQNNDYLVKFLPSIQEVNGFVKDEVTIEDPCEECLPTVNILYQKAGKGDMGEDYSDLGKTISITITDCANAKDYLNAMLEIGSDSQISFNILDKYEGLKEVEQNDFGIQQCGYTYSVADRFLIQIIGGSGDLFNEINVLLNNIDHSAMENFK